MKHPHEWLQNYYWLKSTSHETFSTSDHDVLMGYRSQVNVPSPKLFRPAQLWRRRPLQRHFWRRLKEGRRQPETGKNNQGTAWNFCVFTKYQENYGLWCTLVYCHGTDNSPITWTPIHEWIQY